MRVCIRCSLYAIGGLATYEQWADNAYAPNRGQDSYRREMSGLQPAADRSKLCRFSELRGIALFLNDGENGAGVASKKKHLGYF
jgi:hypothetical protein